MRKKILTNMILYHGTVYIGFGGLSTSKKLDTEQETVWQLLAIFQFRIRNSQSQSMPGLRATAIRFVTQLPP
jgi:hypothetical protein